MKKVLLSMVLLFAIVFGGISSVNANSNTKFKGQTLTIFNVEDYISSGADDSVDLIAKFEKEYGVKVNYYTYDTNETMYNQFTLQKEGTYDLVSASEYMIQKMIKNGLIIPMEDYAKNIPNYEKYAAKELRTKLKNMYVKTPDQKEVSLDEYAVGYMWGTLGIVYDPEASDTIKDDVKSWDVFWDTKYANQISLKNSIREACVVGVMHAYSKLDEFKTVKDAYLDNPTEENCKKYNKIVQETLDFRMDGSKESDVLNKEKIQKIKEELISVKKNIFGFELDSGKNDIITGKIKMNLAYSGDAVYSINTAKDSADKRLEYYVPEDGSNIWYDAWTMPKGANKELAYEFLNFLSDPTNAAENMDYIGYTSYIVGDALFTLAGTWYGATDYCDATPYYAEDETLVIYEDKLFKCIKDKEANENIYPTNSEYFECLEYDESKEYSNGDMVSKDKVLYNCIFDGENTTKAPITDEASWQKVNGYDLGYLYDGTLSEGRRAIIYPLYGYENLLEAQYPSKELTARCAIMNDFAEYNDQVVIMWGQVKAYTNMIPFYIFLGVVMVVSIILIVTYFILRKKSYMYKKALNK